MLLHVVLLNYKMFQHSVLHPVLSAMYGLVELGGDSSRIHDSMLSAEGTEICCKEGGTWLDLTKYMDLKSFKLMPSSVNLTMLC
jgi:hypothetical protein